MYPRAFDYAAPATVEEALSLIAEYGSEAKLLAGGQSLIPILKLRFASPSLLVDLNRIPGLDGITETGSQLRIGAMARHSQLLESRLLSGRYPVIPAAASRIADPLTRNLGTLGGSLAHADPSGDWASVILALRGDLVLRGLAGERVVAAREFYRGVFRTVLEPGEILTEIRVPRPAGPAGGTYIKMERRVSDFATVGVAVQLELAGERVRRAGIGLTAVADRNIVAVEAEEALAGTRPTADAFATAGRLAAEAARPRSDSRGSVEYKREMVRVFVERGLRRALELAQGDSR